MPGKGWHVRRRGPIPGYEILETVVQVRRPGALSERAPHVGRLRTLLPRPGVKAVEDVQDVGTVEVLPRALRIAGIEDPLHHVFRVTL